MIPEQETINRVTLIGRVTSEPELRTTETRVPVLSFQLETVKRWVGQTGEHRTRSEEHLVSFFGARAAEFGRVILKGGMAWVEGEIQHRKRDGAPMVTFISANFITPWVTPG